MRIFTQRAKTLLRSSALLLPLIFLGSGCSEDDDKKDAADDPVLPGGASGAGTSVQNITLSGSLSTGSALALAATDYTLYCVTFEATPKSASDQLDANGAFSLDVWSGVNFGCFVNDASNMPVATLKIVGDDTDLGQESSGAFALGSSLSLGDVALDLEKGVVEIAKSVVDASKAADDTQIVLDDIHNQAYTMACSSSGNSEIDAQCAQFIEESPRVFLRVLKATEDGEEVTGMGVWASEDAFTNCGSYDFGTGEIEGVSFSQGDDGDYSAESACDLRDDEEDSRPDKRYAIGKMTPSGLGYSFSDGDEYEVSQSCQEYFSVKIEFSGTSALMYGSFVMSETYSEGCTEQERGDRSGVKSFVVSFTQQ